MGRITSILLPVMLIIVLITLVFVFLYTVQSESPLSPDANLAGIKNINFLETNNPNSTAYSSSGSGACSPPIISLSAPVINGSSVSVNGVVTPGSGCSIVSITWTWGDNITSTGWFPASHAYLNSGTYNITATAHQSNGQTSSISTTVTVTVTNHSYTASTSASSCTRTNNATTGYPASQHYNPYTQIPGGMSEEFSQNIYEGESGLSFGVYSGTASILVTQGNNILYNGSLTGMPFDYVIVTPGHSFGCINFLSNATPIAITVHNKGTIPVYFAYNLYNASITASTASLIMYPPQFAVNLGPPTTPNNTGMSFILKAPNYSAPTPLSIWIGEGYSGSTKSWWAQIGFNDWKGHMNVSYAGWGIFSNIQSVGNPGGTDLNYSLIPGDYYNFTMELISNTTWAFLVNGVPIREGALSGYFNTTSAIANSGADLGLETLTDWGASVNITNPIDIPLAMEFRVNGRWIPANTLQLNAVGENWWNGNATIARGIDLWGIQGNVQNSSINKGRLLFSESSPPIIDTPIWPETLYGFNSSLQLGTHGPDILEPNITTKKVVLSSTNASAYTYVIFLGSDNKVLQMTPAIVNGTYSLNVPANTSAVQVYATTGYSKSYQAFYQALQNNISSNKSSVSGTPAGTGQAAYIEYALIAIVVVIGGIIGIFLAKRFGIWADK